MLPRRRRTVQPTPRELAERSERRRKKGEVEWDGRGEAEIGQGRPLKDVGNGTDVGRGSVLECAWRTPPLWSRDEGLRHDVRPVPHAHLGSAGREWIHRSDRRDRRVPQSRTGTRALRSPRFCGQSLGRRQGNWPKRTKADERRGSEWVWFPASGRCGRRGPHSFDSAFLSANWASAFRYWGKGTGFTAAIAGTAKFRRAGPV